MILVPTRSITRDEVGRALVAEGYQVSHRVPRTGTAQSTDWERGADKVAYSSDLLSGLAFFLVVSPEPDRVEAQLNRLFPCERAAALVAREARALEPAAQARAALKLLELGRFLRLDPAISRADIAAALSSWMQSDHRAVRTAAVEAAFTHDWAELGPAIEAMSAKDPALAWVDPWWKKSRSEAEERARKDEEKNARAALLASLPKLVAEERWDEALSASEKGLLPSKKPALACLEARALALEGLGRPWEALFWACFWAASDGGAEAKKARSRLAAKIPRDAGSLTEQVTLAWKNSDDTDVVTDALAMMRREAAKSDRSDDLAFLEGALLVKKSYQRSKQKAARELLEGVAARRPALAEAWTLLALARNADDDEAGAEAAYAEARRSIAAGCPSDRDRDLAGFARELGVEAVTEASILASLRWMYDQASDHEGSFRVATEQLALDLPAKERAEALRARGIAATFLKRHDEAIRDYRAAIDAGDDDEGGLAHFNLACELARAGQKVEALEALRGAIERDEEWSAKARTDDYFSAIWGDREFIVTTSGLKSAPSREEVERWLSRSLGWSMRGDGDASIAEANLAVAGSLLLEDQALLARALGQLGSAETYYANVERAIETTSRASAIAREVFADDGAKLARILHFQGAALHAAKRYDEAEAIYGEVLALREAALGADDFEFAITLGDLARSASDRGRADEAARLQARSRAALDAALAKATGDDRLDILLNLALNEGNRAATALQAGLDTSVVLDHAEALAGFLEALVEGGGSYSAQTLPRIRRVIGDAIKSEEREAVTSRAFAIANRLMVLETPDPRERAEKMYWAILRGGIRDLIAGGASETEIAAGIARAVRGDDPGEPVASHPAFHNLAAELAARLTGSTDIVMVAMSLDLAVSGAQPVEEAIGGLEAFALANLSK